MMRALRERHIPFFTDAKRKLASYAASEATLFALRAAGGSYLREDMLALVKRGCAALMRSRRRFLKTMPLRAEYAAARSNPPLAKAHPRRRRKPGALLWVRLKS